MARPLAARSKVSISDTQNFGTGPSAYELLRPSRYADIGVDHGCVVCTVGSPCVGADSAATPILVVSGQRMARLSPLLPPTPNPPTHACTHTFTRVRTRRTMCTPSPGLCSDFVEPRGQEEIRDIFASIGHVLSDEEFERVWWRVRAWWSCVPCE